MTTNTPSDPCREALQTLVDAPKTNQPGKYEQFANAVDNAQAALDTPNPLPELLAAVYDECMAVVVEECEEFGETVAKAAYHAIKAKKRAALAKWGNR